MGSVHAFTIREEMRNRVVRLALTGELDLRTAPMLTDRLIGFEGDGIDGIILDLRELSFVDSSGLHAFRRAKDHAATNGHRLAIVGASRGPRQVFDLTQTEYLLAEPEALALLDQFTGGKATRSDQRSDGQPGA